MSMFNHDTPENNVVISSKNTRAIPELLQTNFAQEYFFNYLE